MIERHASLALIERHVSLALIERHVSLAFVLYSTNAILRSNFEYVLPIGLIIDSHVSI